MRIFESDNSSSSPKQCGLESRSQWLAEGLLHVASASRAVTNLIYRKLSNHAGQERSLGYSPKMIRRLYQLWTAIAEPDGANANRHINCISGLFKQRCTVSRTWDLKMSYCKHYWKVRDTKERFVFDECHWMLWIRVLIADLVFLLHVIVPTLISATENPQSSKCPCAPRPRLAPQSLPNLPPNTLSWLVISDTAARHLLHHMRIDQCASIVYNTTKIPLTIWKTEVTYAWQDCQ